MRRGLALSGIGVTVTATSVCGSDAVCLLLQPVNTVAKSRAAVNRVVFILSCF